MGFETLEQLVEGEAPYENPIAGILMRARDVPGGAVVTKPTGQKTYTLVDQIRIFNENGAPRIIKAEPGTFFMVNGADINAIGEDKAVMWRPGSLDAVQDWLEELFAGTPQ